jgi:hypothetical protein
MSTFEQRKSMRGTGDGKQDRKGSVDAQAVLNLICSVMGISKSTHLLGPTQRSLVLGFTLARQAGPAQDGTQKP